MRTEKDAWTMNGFLGLLVIFILIQLVILNSLYKEYLFTIVFSLLIVLLLSGFTIIAPNEANTITFFGRYIGSIRKEGIVITVPFSTKEKISLKIQSIEEQMFLQNEQEKQTLHIVLFYKIVDTAKVLFEIDQLDNYLRVQLKVVVLSLMEKDAQAKAQAISDQQTNYSKKQLSEDVLHMLNERLNKVGIEVIDVHLFE